MYVLNKSVRFCVKEDVNSDDENNKYVTEETCSYGLLTIAWQLLIFKPSFFLFLFFVYQKLGSFVILCGLQLSFFWFLVEDNVGHCKVGLVNIYEYLWFGKMFDLL